jgi:hypothetical protein
MNTELISMIEGAAPTIAAALVPGALSGPTKMLADLAISHLAEGLGLPAPSAPEDILAALTGAAEPVRVAVLSRADANFQSTLAPVSAPAPTTPTAEPPASAAAPVTTHAGVTSDLTSMIVYVALASIGGALAHKGIDLSNLSQAILGSPDLHVGAGIIAGAITLLWRNVIGTNRNTIALASSDKS